MDQMISWLRNKLNKYNFKTNDTVVNRRVGFVEEKPNVWRVVYVDNN